MVAEMVGLATSLASSFLLPLNNDEKNEECFFGGDECFDSVSAVGASPPCSSSAARESPPEMLVLEPDLIRFTYPRDLGNKYDLRAFIYLLDERRLV
jgi:hypothetical protein